jgi:hypothetical protein
MKALPCSYRGLLLLVGRRQFSICEKSFGSMDFWVLNPKRYGITLAEGLCNWGREGVLKLFHNLGKRAMPLLYNTLGFALHLRKSAENLSKDSRIVLRH